MSCPRLPLAAALLAAAASLTPIRADGPTLPLRFEPDLGQLADGVEFSARAAGFELRLHAGGAAVVAAGSGEVLALTLEDADTEGLFGVDRLASHSNYYRGGPRPLAVRGVPHYGAVEYRRVWPGVDLLFHAAPGVLQYDFHVAPGADPGSIVWSLGGARSVELVDGALEIELESGRLTMRRPFLFQEVDGRRRQVDGSFRLLGPRRVGFAVGDYDATRELVIDPQLVFASFLGWSESDLVRAVAVDDEGRAFAAGSTSALDLAVGGAAGDVDLQSAPSGVDGFVARFAPDGGSLDWVTYLVGGGADEVRGLALDADVGPVVVGSTTSPSFLAPGKLESPSQTGTPVSDAFCARLDAGGALVRVSTFGGSGSERGAAVAVDAGGNAFVTGTTDSAWFPTTPGSAVTSRDQLPAHGGDRLAFVRKESRSGALAWSTLLGGDGNDYGNAIAVDGSGRAHVTGATGSGDDFPLVDEVMSDAGSLAADAFLTIVSADGSAFEYSTLLGGYADDAGHGIALGADGSVVVVGGSIDRGDSETAHAVFPPEVGGLMDGCVCRLSGTPPALDSVRYFGGGANDIATAVARDRFGSVYVTGFTMGGLPLVRALQETPPSCSVPPPSSGPPPGEDGWGAPPVMGPPGDDLVESFPDFVPPHLPSNGPSLYYDCRHAFVAKLTADAQHLSYSTYLGGDSEDQGLAIAVDGDLRAVVGGRTGAGPTGSSDFPVHLAPVGAQPTYGGGTADGFVVALDSSCDSPADGASSLIACEGFACVEVEPTKGALIDLVPIAGGTVLAMDRDGDGRDDLVEWIGGAWLLYGDGGEPLHAACPKGSWADARPVPADWDGDGRDEMGLYVDGTFAVLDPWSGELLSWVGTPAPEGARPFALDTDGDGRAELALVHSGALWTFGAKGEPTGSFDLAKLVGASLGDAFTPVFLDANGDCIDNDVVVVADGAAHVVDLLDGVLESSTTLEAFGDDGVPAALDHDGDGRAELAVLSGGLWLLYGDDFELERVVESGTKGGVPVSRTAP